MTGSEYRVLVTGSRHWPAGGIRGTVAKAIVRALRDAARWDENTGRPSGLIVIVHGACPTGVDPITDQWALDNSITVERHPPDWHRYGYGAAIRRNTTMVQSADPARSVCVAVIAPCHLNDRCTRRPWPHGSHAATDCADQAERAGIPVRPVPVATGDVRTAVVTEQCSTCSVTIDPGSTYREVIHSPIREGLSRGQWTRQTECVSCFDPWWITR